MFLDRSSSKRDLEHTKTALVLGGGVSGEAAGKLLKELGAKVYLADRSGTSPWDGWEAVLSDSSEEIPTVDLAIKSPGISPLHPILTRFSPGQILSEIALGRLIYPGKILGITGTDGKSTSTALTHHLISGEIANSAVGGNLGEAFTSFCQRPWDLVVLELSSYQLEDSLPLHLTHSAITNLAPDHLERHITMENYALAKWKIQNLEDPNHQCISQNSVWIQMPFSKPRPPGLLFFGTDTKSDIQILAKEKTLKTKTNEYDVSFFPLPGFHNLQNLAVAIALSEAVNISPTSIQERLQTFSGLPHRFSVLRPELLKDSPFQGFQFINDSKSTNLHSMLSGLSGYSENDNIYLILGGEPKSESLIPFFERWKDLPTMRVFVYGKASQVWKKDFESFIEGRVQKQQIWFIPELAVTVPFVLETIKQEAKRNGIVLLSPACASFDLYKNFQERGEHFERLLLKHLK